MRLREGLRVVRRSDVEVQVGTDPRWAVRIDGLSPAERDALLDADSEVAGHASLPTGTPRLRAIADQLAQVQLAVPSTTPQRRRGAGAADSRAWDLMDGTGTERLARRSERTVGVLGLGPAGATAAVQLAAAGVGTVLVDDPRPVRSIDVGPCGYRWEDVGCARQTVLARLLRDVAPDAGLERGTGPDLLVLVEHGARDTVRGAMLLAHGISHLSVLVRDADVVVGPLVTIGPTSTGPCLHCLDLHHGDLDPRWSTVAGAIARPSREGVEMPVLAGVAGALAAAVVLDHLDTGTGLAATYEVGLPDVVPRRRDWAAHPSCGCAAQFS